MLIYKSIHIIAMVAWFAGLFYLPRLFVYHADAEDKISQERFKVMERRLFYAIMTPAAIVTAIFGFILLYANIDYYLEANWMHAKMILVAVLASYHILCGYYVYQFKHNKNRRNSKFFRFYNEVPTLLLITIVLLAVVRPAIF